MTVMISLMNILIIYKNIKDIYIELYKAIFLIKNDLIKNNIL